MTTPLRDLPLPVPTDATPSARTLRPRADADAGRTVPVAEVRRWVESWDTDREEPVPRVRDRRAVPSLRVTLTPTAIEDLERTWARHPVDRYRAG